MSSSRNVQLGNYILLETTHDNGIVEFRVDPGDVEPEHLLLRDAAGRTKEVVGHASTVLFLVPVGEIGAFVYDPEIVFEKGNAVPVREDGKRCYKQRNVLSRLDVLTIVEEVARNMEAAEERRIVLPNDAPRRPRLV